MPSYPGSVFGIRLVGVAALSCAVALAVPAAPVTAAPVAVADEIVGLVVTREDGTSAKQAQAAVAEVVDTETERQPVAPGVTAVATPGLTATEARAAARKVARQDGIAAVGLDTRVTPDAVVDDPLFGQQWSLTDPVSGANAVPAWELTRGSGAVVAVVDTGVLAHEDLEANLLPGYDFVEDPVVANDGDGRDPDASDPGDWVDSTDVDNHPDVFNNKCIRDSTWHGTHVAGLAGAVADNATGVAGLAPEVQVLPVRALGKCGGSMSDVVAGLTWASGGRVPGVPDNPTPADVINLSLSSEVACQQYVQSAIDGAISRGSTVVVSAGNKYESPISAFSPAGCYDVVAVGALQENGQPAAYSNVGVPARDPIVYAPGGTSASGLVSTIDTGATVPAADGYDDLYGTSMAAPLVAAAAALLGQHTQMTPLAIGEHLRDTAREFPCGLSNCGAGALDVDAALRTSPTLPKPVADLTAQAADGSIALRWTAPDDTGSAPLTDYDLQYRRVGGAWIPVRTRWPNTLDNRIIAGLTNGVDYQVRVAPRTVFGAGAWTESGTVRPLTLPDPVRIRSVKYPSKRSARLALTLPSSEISGLQWRVAREGVKPGDFVDASAAAALRIADLPKGVRHVVEVRAVNALGAGPSDSRIIATPVRPTKVRALRVKVSGKRLTVSWRAPKRTGRYPKFRVRIAGRPWQKTRKTVLKVRAPERTPYVVAVRARNEVGNGPIVKAAKRK